MFAKELRLANAREALKYKETLEKYSPHLVEAYIAQTIENEILSAPKAGEQYAWIGINPPPNTYSLLELYQRLLLVNPYPSSIAAVEQHTHGGLRPHIHQLVRVSLNTRKNHVITKLAKAWGLEPTSIQVTLTKSIVLKAKWTAYLEGRKVDSKMDKVERDREDREKVGVPHLISL